MYDEDFSKNLIKGKIAEVIFQQMFREQGGYTIIPFGYEYTVPQLAQCNGKNAKRIIDNIRHAPDFAMVSSDNQNVYLVEIKFQSRYSEKYALKDAEIQKERWDPSWIFIATLDGFCFDVCSSIISRGGVAKKLSENWVAPELQEKYLKLLQEFENN